jgi:hypothetical protein
MKTPATYFLLLFVLLASGARVFAQNDPTELARLTNVWYAGSSSEPGPGAVRINFQSGISALLDSLARPLYVEGSSTISDGSSFLAYSDGAFVCGDSGILIQNGDSIMGSNLSTSTQGTLFVPIPNSPNLYYLFTTGDAFYLGAGGLRYSLINANLNGGRGGIVDGQKNVLLFAPSSEKLCAVHHCNGKDIWVITWAADSNFFYSYLVTELGLITTPIVSSVGLSYPQTGSPWDSEYLIGTLKASPNGKYLAITHGCGINRSIQLFKLDNSTGLISNPVNLSPFDGCDYGISFSPNSTKLYVSGMDTSNGIIVQYDLTVDNPLEIVNSRTIIYLSLDYYTGTMQIGPDHKIYVAQYSDHLGVIANPNENGILCDFLPLSIPLNGGFIALGLANHPDSYFNEEESAFPCFQDTADEQLPQMPNVVTANGDGINDYFPPKSYSGFWLSIYDRWGVEVYNGNTPWLPPNSVPTGVYFYVIQFTTQQQVRSGTFTLLH